MTADHDPAALTSEEWAAICWYAARMGAQGRLSDAVAFHKLDFRDRTNRYAQERLRRAVEVYRADR